MYSYNGNKVFTGGDDGRFLQISPDGTIIEIANFGTRWVDTVATTNNNMVCSSGKNAYLWTKGNTKEKILEHPSFCFDRSGKRLAVASYGGVTLWEQGNRKWKSSRLVWKGSHSKVSFSPDGKYRNYYARK